LVAAIERGLASYSVETCTVAADGPYEIDTISTSMVDRLGTRRTENAFWNFKAGMTLRFFGALRRSSHPALQSIAARYRERMDLFEIVLRSQLERSITSAEEGIEIRTAVSAGETNSETQPWVMLGLFGHQWD
jgi:molybdopterin-guanine dinucleotide biosynthesis protein A